MIPSTRHPGILLVAALLLLAPSIAPAQSWQWAQLQSGTDHDMAERVTVDSLGNSYVMGRFSGTINLGVRQLSGIGLWDTYVAKYDPAGALAWAISMSGPGNDLPGDIAVDRAGNVYVTGSFSGNAVFGSRAVSPRGGSDVWLAKLLPGGLVEWLVVGGSPGNDHGAGVALDETGQYVYITGSFSGQAAFSVVELESAGGTDVFVARYTTAQGGLQWARRGGGPRDDAAVGLGVDAFGSAFIAGRFTDSATFAPYTIATPQSDSGAIFVAKYDFAGIPRWAVTGGALPRAMGPIAVAVDLEGNAFIAGSFTDSVTIGTTKLVSAGGSDAFLARCNPFGGFRWAVREGDSLNDFGFGVGVDNSGNPYLTGAIDNTGTLAPDTTYRERMLLVRYTAAGARSWADTTDGGRLERGLDVGLDRIGNHFVAGHFLDTLRLGDVTLVETGARSDAFVAKLGPDATIVTTALDDTLLCAGSTVTVEYTIGGSFFNGNIFRAQISDSTGSFALPTIIGTLTGAGAGAITSTIPAWLPAGSRYRIRVVASNPEVNGADNGVDLDVEAMPRPRITGSIDDTLCRGETVTLDAGEGWAAQRWSTGATSRTITVTNSGAYHVTVTSLAGCDGRSDTARIVVFELPAKPVITVLGAQLRVAPGVTHQWYRDGVAIPGATSERYTPTASGSYTVTVYNEGGCGTTSDPFIYSSTGVREELGASGVSIERVGADLIVVEGRCAIAASLVDMSGRVVIESARTERTELDLRGVATGVYLLRVRGCDGVETIRKVTR
ncbi:MAG TPA: SBBP repeat-containing protein [Candidatus Kapabacteria bacterium]|nr:SBBP repeat-containing protein [Candidatus Kapabacteria bacterium]